MIAIITSNPRFYTQTVEELKRKGIPFLSLSPSEDIPPVVDIVITTEAEKGNISFLRVVASDSPLDAVEQVADLARGVKTSYKNLFIGLDPGKNIGLSVVGDGGLVYEKGLSHPDDVVKEVERLANRFDSENLIIRIGAAGGAYRNRIIASLQERFSFPLELVDEGSTSRPRGEVRELGVNRDVLAARLIANKRGVQVVGKVRAVSTPGEIKNVQRESRKKSGNITISTALADAVVRGEIGLDEAIKRQQRR